ncbi:hypothetical protein [Halobacteriovorax sp.]|uniref:hypothetical protein n=1 Tax=Halobacteriovorax sp. TaxID=2020862 RepID=UPI003AF2CC73
MTKNKLSDVIKFITVFVLFLAITLPTYYYLNPSKAQETISELKEEDRLKRCEEYIQECYRRDLIQLIGSARLIDIVNVKDFISYLHKMDLKKVATNEKQAIVNLLYLENLVIYLNHSREVKVDRNSIDFFDIFFISKTKKDLKKLVDSIKKEAREVDLRGLPNEIIYRRDMALKSIASFEYGN